MKISQLQHEDEDLLHECVVVIQYYMFTEAYHKSLHVIA